MLDFSDARIALLATHRVGNKSKKEANFISTELIEMDGVLEDVMFRFFVKPLKKAYDKYKFTHHADLSHNELFQYCQAIFNDQSVLHEQSIHMLNHLYEQADHPNIKTGELYVAFFRDILYEDEMLNGIGIFKTEKRSKFLRINEQNQALKIEAHEGILAEKMDKGCIILNTEEGDGYRIFSYDNNNYDTLYWSQRFLNVVQIADDHFHTKQYVDLCSAFSESVIAPLQDQSKKIDFISRSAEYFSNHEIFDVDEFTTELMPSSQARDQFEDWRTDFGLEEVQQFNISKAGYREAKKAFKGLIQLDTEIEIKISLKNPEEKEQFIERGFDAEKGMNFYKVYFNEEY